MLACCPRQTVVKLSGLPDAALEAATVPGYSSLVKSSWGLQVEIGPVMFGQTRDVIVSVPQHSLAGDGAAAKVTETVIPPINSTGTVILPPISRSYSTLFMFKYDNFLV